MGFPMPAFGMSCLGLSMSVLDPATIASSMFLRGLFRLDLLLLAFGISWLDSLTFALDFVNLELLLLLQTFIQLGLSPLTYGVA